MNSLRAQGLFILLRFIGSFSWSDVRSKVRDVVCSQIVKPYEANELNELVWYLDAVSYLEHFGCAD